MSKKKTDEELLVEIRANFLLAEEAEIDFRAEALDCWKFRAGEQWDPKVLRKRDAKGRPCYVINRVPQFIRQVANEQKQSRPAIQVDSLGDGATKETAEIVQGLARHSELISDAAGAYDQAFDHMLTGGFGYFRLRTDYVTSSSWDQDILIDPISNPFSVYLDPRARRRDRRDAKWGFIITEMSAAEFSEEYPESSLAGLTEYSGVGDSDGWVLRDTLRVAEYYGSRKETKTLCKLSDGSTCFEEDVSNALAPGLKVIAKKKQQVICMTWYKTNGIEILDREEIPGDYVPIIAVLGDEFWVEGTHYLVGVVAWLREPARLYNLWKSAMAETIALAPKAPYRATVKQIEGFEDVWDTANEDTYSVLPYNADPAAPGPPQRDFGEPPIQAISEAIAQADNDMKAVTGLYDPSLGKPGPEESARAILLRQKQGDQANFNFLDSMAFAIRHAGRVFLGWLGKVYDTKRVIRIVRPDGSQETVPINQLFQDGAVARLYDLTVGTFDIAIAEGASVESRRAEASEAMLSLIQASPELMSVCGDLLVKNFDWPYADEIAERLKKMLPPQLQDQADGQQPVPMAAQQKIAAQDQLLERLTTAVHALSAKLESQQIQAASRERIALINAKAGILEAALKAKSVEGLAIFKADLEQIDRQIALVPDPALGEEADGPGPDGGVVGSAPAPAPPGIPAGPPPALTPATPLAA